MPKHQQPDREQQLREERAEAEARGDTARAAEIDRELGEDQDTQSGQANL